MNTPAPSKLGNVIDVDPAWVAKVTEAALEPELPIVDPHHHLWQRAGNDYMFHDLLADTRTGPPWPVFRGCKGVCQAKLHRILDFLQTWPSFACRKGHGRFSERLRLSINA